MSFYIFGVLRSLIVFVFLLSKCVWNESESKGWYDQGFAFVYLLLCSRCNGFWFFCLWIWNTRGEIHEVLCIGGGGYRGVCIIWESHKVVLFRAVICLGFSENQYYEMLCYLWWTSWGVQSCIWLIWLLLFWNHISFS